MKQMRAVAATGAVFSLLLLGACSSVSQTSLSSAETGTCWTDLNDDDAVGTEVDCAQSHELEILAAKDFHVQGVYDYDYLSQQTENFCSEQLPAYAPEGFDDFDSIQMFVSVPTEEDWESYETVTGLCGVRTTEPTTGNFSDQ